MIQLSGKKHRLGCWSREARDLHQSTKTEFALPKSLPDLIGDRFIENRARFRVADDERPVAKDSESIETSPPY